MNISLLRKRALEAGVAVPAIVLMSAGLATPAYAQNNGTNAAGDACDTTTDPNCKPTSSDQVILVTGSILQRTDTETASPVTAITSEQLEQRGINSVSEGLNRLAANGSGTLSEYETRIEKGERKTVVINDLIDRGTLDKTKTTDFHKKRFDRWLRHNSK